MRTQLEMQTKWWDDVTIHWDNLLKIIDDWHPASRELTLDQQMAQPPMDITATRAERSCGAVRRQILKEEAELPSPTIRASKAKEEKDHEVLLNLFNSAWFGVPESMGSWAIPGFGVLCDLCGDGPEAFQPEEEMKEEE